jgi:hypothetical protein
MKNKKKREWHKENIVSIDFDGVLMQYNGWKGANATRKPMKGAREFVLKLIETGYKPVVFTTRKPPVVNAWLKRYEFPKIEVTNTKHPSVVYIDDRCVKFDGSYAKLTRDLKKYDVYWRKKKTKIFSKLFSTKANKK